MFLEFFLLLSFIKQNIFYVVCFNATRKKRRRGGQLSVVVVAAVGAAVAT